MNGSSYNSPFSSSESEVRPKSYRGYSPEDTPGHEAWIRRSVYPETYRPGSGNLMSIPVGFGSGRHLGTFAPNRHSLNKGREPRGYRRSDERIREVIQEELSADTEIDASSIVPDVTDGEVELTGTVRDRFTRRRCEDIVWNISGVSQVLNNLRTETT